jgi:hypothetical protein
VESPFRGYNKRMKIIENIFMFLFFMYVSVKRENLPDSEDE